MKLKLVALAALSAGLLFSAPASASCVGTGTFATCTDDSGNSYTVMRSGNSTFVNGTNSNGSTWNQTSTTTGNTTFTNGNTNGRSWNEMQQRVGSSTFTSGTDSHGNSYSSTCTDPNC